MEAYIRGPNGDHQLDNKGDKWATIVSTVLLLQTFAYVVYKLNGAHVEIGWSASIPFLVGSIVWPFNR